MINFSANIAILK